MRYNILHIIVTVLIGMACATSCSSDPQSDILDYEKGEELRFEVADCSTRATTVTTDSNLIYQPFMLFGDVYRDAEFHPGLRTLFEKVKVTCAWDKNNEANTKYKWETEVKQYWHMGQEHSFVAIHPYDIPGMSNIKYENSKVSFTYNMPKQHATELESDIKDIIVATHRRKYNLDSGNSGPVKFKFQHLLSRISVAPALNQIDHMYPADDESKKDIEFGYDLIRNEFIQIRKVELSGFYTKAYLSVTPLSGNQTDDNVVTIDLDKEEKSTISFDLGNDQPPIYNDGKNVSVLDKFTSIMIIPQTFEAGAQIKLEYSVNTDNTEHKELRYVIVPLIGAQLERGKSYTMKFTIEDVYKGQIAKSSLVWEVNDTDIPDSNAGKNWICDTDTIIRQEFGDKKNPNDSEHNNDNEDEE